ncbi:uncharacterized protein LOC113788932 [Dermatophagoides pteronyssinus]|uniref:uncharacterized protein LOC113788932 n=1 Tax=Dermatophagoides pteronyssinus TaxID=6956 RepID=UPI003F66308A
MIQIRLNENENKIREFFIDSYRKKILTDCVIYCHCLKDDDNSGNVGDHNKISSMQRDDISSTETLNLLIDNNNDDHQELDEKYLKFDCHRLILSLYSKFFHHYFCNHHHNDDNNNRQQSMSIFIDIPAKIMDDLLKIIYFGSITIDNEERKLAIISAAFKLGISDNIVIFNNDDNDNNIDKIKIDNQDKDKLLKDQQQQQQQQSSSSSSSKTVIENSSKNLLKKRLLNNSDDDDDHRDNEPGPSSMMNKYFMKPDETMVKQSNSNMNRKQQQQQQTNSIILNRLSKIVPSSSSSNSGGVSSNDNQTKRIAIDQTTTMLYTCQYCQKQYNYEISLKKHVKSAHS